MDFPQLDLPIYKHKSEIAKLLRDRANLIITSEPGTGKSTIIPLIANEENQGQKTLVLVPRRIIATSLTSYVKKLTGNQKTNEIAYHIGHEKTSDASTKIEFVSYGVFILRLLQEQDLPGIATVIFDEFHERHIDSDLALSFCLDLLDNLCPQVQIVIMSATLNVELLKGLLASSKKVNHLHVEGRNFKVNIEYDKPPLGTEFFKNPHLFFDHVAKVIREAQKRTTKDILVFLPGLFEIRQVAKRVQDGEVIVLHSSSRAGEIQSAFEPPRSSRLILSSSLAESSLTLPHVEIVIDSGLVRQNFYDVYKKRDRLVTDFVTQANAHQRAGRAGRVKDGVCIRLWDSGQALLADISAESERSDLSQMALHMASWQRADASLLRALSPPNARLWREALGLLREYDFVDDKGVLKGHKIDQNARSLHPRLQFMWARHKDRSELHRNCALLVIGLVLSEEKVNSKGIIDFDSTYESFDRETRQTLNRLGNYASVENSKRAYEIVVELCIEALGLAKRVAKGEYSLSDGLMFKLDANTSDYIVPINLYIANDRASCQNWIDIDEITMKKMVQDKAYEPLVELKGQRFTCKKVKKIGLFSFGEVSMPYDKDFEDLARREVLRVLGEKGLSYFCDDEGLALLERYNYCQGLDRSILKDQNTDFSNVHLSDFNKLIAFFQFDQNPILSTQNLSYVLKDLCLDGFDIDRAAPRTLVLPQGKKVAIDYPRPGNDLVKVSIRLQDAFGFRNHPNISGRPILLELLSPAMRPIQRTSDIMQFWDGSYKEVRKEMRGRYPKHKWPENPLDLD